MSLHIKPNSFSAREGGKGGGKKKEGKRVNVCRLLPVREELAATSFFRPLSLSLRSRRSKKKNKKGEARKSKKRLHVRGIGGRPRQSSSRLVHSTYALSLIEKRKKEGEGIVHQSPADHHENTDARTSPSCYLPDGVRGGGRKKGENRTALSAGGLPDRGVMTWASTSISTSPSGPAKREPPPVFPSWGDRCGLRPLLSLPIKTDRKPERKGGKRTPQEGQIPPSRTGGLPSGRLLPPPPIVYPARSRGKKGKKKGSGTQAVAPAGALGLLDSWEGGGEVNRRTCPSGHGRAFSTFLLSASDEKGEGRQMTEGVFADELSH